MFHRVDSVYDKVTWKLRKKNLLLIETEASADKMNTGDTLMNSQLKNNNT